MPCETDDQFPIFAPENAKTQICMVIFFVLVVAAAVLVTIGAVTAINLQSARWASFED